MFCCKMSLYNAIEMLEMRRGWERSYELVIHNIILQLLDQKIPDGGGWGGVVTVRGCELRDVLGGVESPVMEEERGEEPEEMT